MHQGHFDRSNCDEDIDKLIASDALESAAYRLMGKEFGYMISSAPGTETVSISVWMPALEDEVRVEASSITLALIAGTCAAMFHTFGAGDLRGANLN